VNKFLVTIKGRANEKQNNSRVEGMTHSNIGD
jgi:hypothetical protein